MSGINRTTPETIAVTSWNSLGSSATAWGGSEIHDLRDGNGQLPHNAILFGKVTTGTSPTAGNKITLYLYPAQRNAADSAWYIEGRLGSNNWDDEDEAITEGTAGDVKVENTPHVGKVITVEATSDEDYEFRIDLLAALGSIPDGIAVACRNESGVALNATGGVLEVVEHRAN